MNTQRRVNEPPFLSLQSGQRTGNVSRCDKETSIYLKDRIQFFNKKLRGNQVFDSVKQARHVKCFSGRARFKEVGASNIQLQYILSMLNRFLTYFKSQNIKFPPCQVQKKAVSGSDLQKFSMNFNRFLKFRCMISFSFS